MRIRKLLFNLLAVILGGCVPVLSLHPLYDEKDVVFQKNLLGVWVDDCGVDDSNEQMTWQFRRPDESKKAYELTYSDNEGNKGIFTVHLLKLEGRLFLDVYPNHLPAGQLEEPNEAPWPYNKFFFIPVHTFIKIDLFEPASALKNRVGKNEPIDTDTLKILSGQYDYILNMQLTDDDAFRELLKEDPNSVEYETVDHKVVLTASTKELQAFVSKYADDTSLFATEIELARKKSNGPQQASEQDPNDLPVGQDTKTSQKQQSDKNQ